MGALGGKSGLGLECLRDLEPRQVARAKALLAEGKVDLHLPDNELLLYCKIVAHGGGHTGAAELRDSHANITTVWRDDVPVFTTAEVGAAERDDAPKEWPLSLTAIHTFATTASLQEIAFILDAAHMNRTVAEEGLARQYGLAVGKSMDTQVRRHILADDIVTFAVKLTAAAADARMAGVMMPVMSNSGSGNQGIICTMPVVACAIRLEKSNEELARALIMNHLTAIHIKHHLGGFRLIAVPWWPGQLPPAASPSCWGEVYAKWK